MPIDKDAFIGITIIKQQEGETKNHYVRANLICKRKWIEMKISSLLNLLDLHWKKTADVESRFPFFISMKQQLGSEGCSSA